MTDRCCLCAQIAGEPAGDLLHALLGHEEPYRRRVVDVDDGFVAMPSIGALVPGHLLLCPRQHVRSLAAVESVGAVARVADRARTRLAQWAGAPVQAFEHGNARDGTKVACTVEHAHLHLLPGLPDLWMHVEQAVTWHLIRDGLRGLAGAVGDQEYVLYIAADGLVRVTFPQDSAAIPSQWLRQVAATAMGVPDRWNWREQPNPSLMDASFRAAEAALT